MKLLVFKGQYGYSTLAKNGDNKLYIQVQFNKGTEPEGERARIKINDAFFSNYTNKAGITFPKLVIMDYTIVEDTAQNNTADEDFSKGFPTNTEVPDDLPF